MGRLGLVVRVSASYSIVIALNFSSIPPRGSVRVRVSSYPNINRGTYVPACVSATSHDVAAVYLSGEAAGHAGTRRTCELAAKPRAAKPRHVAAKPRHVAAKHLLLSCFIMCFLICN